jgi:2-polyprenyl-3-methyl-5-hydroxy-6-metoxy-1,4-benzoquinol methylase
MISKTTMPTRSTETAPRTPDPAKLQDLLHRMVGDMGAAAAGALVITGDRLGLYRVLSTDGPFTARELAERSQTHERYVQEWLAAQSASGYVTLEAQTERFFLTPEQSALFAGDDSPMLLTGGYYAISSMYRDEDRLSEVFRSGEGIGWGEHDGCLFCGTAKFFRTSYRAHLVQDWLPSLEGVVAKLERGVEAADVGCGHGISTVIMAQAFPRSRFVGFDFHEPSVQEARRLAAEAGLSNVSFEVATAKEYPGQGYELVTCFDCLHDMGDPVGAARHVRQSLADDGTWMLVEPMAHDRLADNMNPVGRLYYALSTAFCTPSSKSQELGAALGAQAGQARLGDVVREGGFRRFRRADETPFNMILEARP